MEKLKDIDTFYSQKVIPLAFNESLSYMEQICNLISYIENTLVPAINNNANAIKELQEYVQELKRLIDKLEQKVDENFITLNTKIDTTKEELNTKIDTTKEELITLINNVNNTLTNAINNLDSKVVEHINASNEKFNALDTSIESINNNIDTINTNIDTINTNIETINTNIGTTNTEVGTIKEQIQTINTNVTQNTNDITNLKKNGLNWNSRKNATIYVNNATANLAVLQVAFATNSNLTYIDEIYIGNGRFNFLTFSEGDYIPYLVFNTKFNKKCFPQDGGIALIQDTVTNIVYSCPCEIDEFPQTITIKVNCSQLKGNTNELKFLGMTGILLFNR